MTLYRVTILYFLNGLIELVEMLNMLGVDVNYLYTTRTWIKISLNFIYVLRLDLI